MANAATATFAGRSLLWSLVRQADTPTEPKNIGWGAQTAAQNTTGSANADVALFNPQTEARVAGTSSMTTSGANVLADTYQVTGSITCLVGAKTITEAGLFDTTTASSASFIATSSQSAGATTITLNATIGPASGNFYIQVENEVQLVTGGQGSTTLTVTRGQLGTTGVAHATSIAATSGGDGHANVNGGGAGGQTATTANVLAKGGNLFAHADFAAINVAINDSILFTWKDQLTALFVPLASATLLAHSLLGGLLA